MKLDITTLYQWNVKELTFATLLLPICSLQLFKTQNKQHLIVSNFQPSLLSATVNKRVSVPIQFSTSTQSRLCFVGTYYRTLRYLVQSEETTPFLIGGDNIESDSDANYPRAADACFLQYQSVKSMICCNEVHVLHFNFRRMVTNQSKYSKSPLFLFDHNAVL